MHILQANLVMNLANTTTISACVLGVAFMLRFLLALTRERNTSLAGFRSEYRVGSALPNAPARQARTSFSAQLSTRPDRSEREYDRGESSTGTLETLKEA